MILEQNETTGREGRLLIFSLCSQEISPDYGFLALTLTNTFGPNLPPILNIGSELF